MQKKTKIKIIILLLLILIGGYFYKDKLKIVKETDIITNDDSAQEVSLNYDEEGKLIITPVEVSQKDLPPAPDLDRKITFSDDFPNDQKDKTITKIKEIISILKKDTTSFENWIELGSYRKMIGDFEGALEAWEYASKISPSSTVSFSNLGNLYQYSLQDYKKAEEYFLKALEVDSSYMINYINLHDLYKLSYKQSTNEAIGILSKGLKTYPNELTLLVPLAIDYKEAGDKENALIYYKKASEVAKETKNNSLYTEFQKEISNLTQ